MASTHETTTSAQLSAGVCAAPYTLRFTEWRCGHHGERPADIPVQTAEQAKLILEAISHAITQSGHARAALFNSDSGVSLYLTDDYAEAVPHPSVWSQRTVIYHATQDELAELVGLQDAFDYCYGGPLEQWDGAAYLDDMALVTTLSLASIEAAITPVSWYEEGQRNAVCEVPPILQSAAVLLAELREVAADLATEGESA